MTDKRYQFQPWHVRAWRCLHYVPYAFWFVAVLAKRPFDGVQRRDWTIGQLWRWGMGQAQLDMDYYYTIEEVVEMEREKLRAER